MSAAALHLPEAGAGELFHQFSPPGKLFCRLVKPCILFSVFSSASQDRHDMPEVETVCRQDDRIVGNEGIQAVNFAARPHDASHLPEDTAVIRRVPEAERDACGIKRSVREGKLHGISLQQLQIGNPLSLLSGSFQHGGGKVKSRDTKARTSLCESDRYVSRAAADIQ